MVRQKLNYRWDPQSYLIIQQNMFSCASLRILCWACRYQRETQTPSRTERAYGRRKSQSRMLNPINPKILLINTNKGPVFILLGDTFRVRDTYFTIRRGIYRIRQHRVGKTKSEA
jgi:hypothetical protein